MAEPRHLTREDLEAWLDEIRRSPKDGGVLQLIVRRPQTGQREVVREAQLDPAAGLVGDDWRTRGCAGTPDGSADPEAQITMISSRVIAHLAQGKERWPLSGDQLFLDLDLSGENLPPGTRLALGSAVIEITEQPHTGKSSCHTTEKTPCSSSIHPWANSSVSAASMPKSCRPE